MKYYLELDTDSFQDFLNISTGLFFPLKGFMNFFDYNSVVNSMQLDNGYLWTIPIALSVNKQQFKEIKQTDRIFCLYKGKQIGYVDVEDCFEVNLEQVIQKVFKTNSQNHPGVKKELKKGKYKIGGSICLTDKSLLDKELIPEKTKEIFYKKGWKTIAGFQTRNPIHKAHEYHHRTAMEMCDGLFINPLVGWKKKGDFTDYAIIASYSYMLTNIYPKNKVHFAMLKTQMRYAGPREAIFHSLIRKNLGCTHFIVGRDHAGVGNYYGIYEAQELAKKLKEKKLLNIDILYFKEPYYCKKCKMICTENTCSHNYNNTDIIRISGTKVRQELALACGNETIFLRNEIADILRTLDKPLFI